MLNNWTEFVPAVKKAFGALGKQHPKMLAAYGALEEASAEGALDAKTRELISIAVAITTRCDGCIGVHTEAALKAGASEAEIAQTPGYRHLPECRRRLCLFAARAGSLRPVQK